MSADDVEDNDDAVEVGDLSARAGSIRNEGTGATGGGGAGVDWRQSKVTALAAFTDEFERDDEFDFAESGLRISLLL